MEVQDGNAGDKMVNVTSPTKENGDTIVPPTATTTDVIGGTFVGGIQGHNAGDSLENASTKNVDENVDVLQEKTVDENVDVLQDETTPRSGTNICGIG